MELVVDRQSSRTAPVMFGFPNRIPRWFRRPGTLGCRPILDTMLLQKIGQPKSTANQIKSDQHGRESHFSIVVLFEHRFGPSKNFNPSDPVGSGMEGKSASPKIGTGLLRYKCRSMFFLLSVCPRECVECTGVGEKNTEKHSRCGDSAELFFFTTFGFHIFFLTKYVTRLHPLSSEIIEPAEAHGVQPMLETFRRSSPRSTVGGAPR